jgi:hypothetical protein
VPVAGKCANNATSRIPYIYIHYALSSVSLERQSLRDISAITSLDQDVSSTLSNRKAISVRRRTTRSSISCRALAALPVDVVRNLHCHGFD